MENSEDQAQKLSAILEADEIEPAAGNTESVFPGLDAKMVKVLNEMSETDLAAFAARQQRISEHNDEVNKARAERQRRKLARRNLVGDHRKPRKRKK